MRHGIGTGIGLLGAAAFAAVFGVSACGKPGAGGSTIQIKGSDTLLHLATEWAETFMKENPDTEIVVTGGGSGTGIAALLNGTCDIANASRKIKDKEVALAKEQGKKIKEYDVALDGIVVIHHPDNPVAELNLEQLEKIYTGRITRWNQVGGPDLEIVVLARDHASGTHAFFNEVVLRDAEYDAACKFLASNSAIVASVGEDLGAIGYVGLGYYENARDKVMGVSVRDGEKDPVFPDKGTVKDGTYLISRSLQCYVVGEPGGALKAYLDFILGEEGQKIVADQGFVPIR